MPQQYTQQQIDKALETLPEELKEAIFSKETANQLYNIYDRTGVTDERAWKISEGVGYVLMGLIMPQEFEGILQKEIKVPKKAAQEIAREINRFVFYPVRPALEQLHGAAATAAPEGTARKPKDKQEAMKEPEEQAPGEPRGPDTYREQIE